MSNGPASSSIANQSEPPHRVMEQAAEWYAVLSSEDATKQEYADWRAWLESDPTHRKAWGYVESISHRFEPLQTTTAPRQTAEGLWQANTRLIQRRRVLASIAILVGTGLVGWGTWRHTPLPLLARAWQADYDTATGETRELTLSDGSRIWLNTATALSQTYDTHKRHLNLLKGEIFISTAADPSRPFTVDTPQGRLKALGTRFTVRLDGEQTLLAVYEGAVQTRTRLGKISTLEAGQQVRFSSEAVNTVEAAQATREAWTRGVLVAQDITLREVVAELRRYRHGHLGLAPEVANLRVFGNFPLTNIDKTLEMLADTLPVRIHRLLPWWVSIEPQKD